jgi:hypothetical protein
MSLWLVQLPRESARRMIAAAPRAEAAEYVARFNDGWTRTGIAR